jgi:hypothetical protein
VTSNGSPANVEPGPRHRHREGDNLWYIHPTTCERFLSVTSALDFADKPALGDRWKPGLAAKAAFDHLPQMIRATRIPPCGQTTSRCFYTPNGHDKRVRCNECPCGDCQPCLVLALANTHFTESAQAAQRGIRVHDVIEWWTLHGVLPEMDDEIRPYVDSFLKFVHDAGLTPDSWEMAEATVLNRTDGWGGTLDGRVRLDATKGGLALDICKKFGKAKPLLSIDDKTREADKAAFYPEMGLQLSAYRRGEVILHDSGEETPLSPDDGAIVVQLHPDGYHWRAVRTGDEVYAAFLGLLEFARWSISDGAAATQVRSFPDLDIPGLKPPAKPAKRARKKATASAVAPDARPLAAVAAQQSTALRAALRLPPHPESPYGDEVPF